MKTLKNRILSGAMAGVLAMSLAVPAFASGNTTEVTGKFKAVTIAVDVMPKAVAFINPYGLDIEVPQDGFTTTGSPATTTIKGQQIVSAPMALKNKTAMDLTVNATVTTTIPEASAGEVAMKLSANTTKGVGSSPEDEGYIAPSTSKSAFVYLEAKQEPTLTGVDGNGGVDAAAIATKFAAWGASTFDAAKNPVLNATRAATQEDLVTLRAADVSSGSFQGYKAGSIALVRLAGDCVTAPRDVWKESDTFTASIAYSFAPADITKYAVTVNVVANGTTGSASVDSANAAEGDTVTLTATMGDAGAVTPSARTASGSTVTLTQVGTDDKWTFTMPAEPVTVTANFAS